MKYKNSLQKIIDCVENHKQNIDKAIELYNVEIQEINNKIADIESQKNKYTIEYIETCKQNMKPTADYTGIMKMSRDKNIPVANHYLKQIEKEINNYFNASVRQEFANKINSISLSGLQLNNREFELLRDSANSYLEMKMIKHLGENRTKNEMQSIVNKDGFSETKQVEVKNPFLNVELPDIDETYREFESLKDSVRTFLNFYCGDSAELKTYLGADIPEYAPLTANSFFRNDIPSRFSNVMDKGNAILSESKQKTELTEQDIAFIDTLIDSRYPSLAEDKVKKLAEYDSSIKELLELDQRYSKYLQDNYEE